MAEAKIKIMPGDEFGIFVGLDLITSLYKYKMDDNDDKSCLSLQNKFYHEQPNTQIFIEIF
jgi:hypothetical protein